MVTFKKDRFIIEIYTGEKSVEYWQDTYYELIEILQSTDPLLLNTYPHQRVLTLIKEMLPDTNTLIKMGQ